MHGQSIIKICNAKQARQIHQYKKIKIKLYKTMRPSGIIKTRILCIKLEINQGYTMMHGQPVIKICNAIQARQIYQYNKIKIKLYKNNAAIWYNKNKNFVHQVGDQPRLHYDARSTNHQELLIVSDFIFKKIFSESWCVSVFIYTD